MRIPANTGNHSAQQTVAALTAPGLTRNEFLARPEFCRLPPPGQRCPLTGMSRSALNELILPSEKNGFKPPVRSFCLRQKGAAKGIRLVDYQSLAAHIRTAGNIEQGVENQ
jgi:hypothetical protein